MKFLLSFVVTFFFFNALIESSHGRLWRKRCAKPCLPCPPPCPKILLAVIDQSNSDAAKKTNLELITSLWNQSRPKLSCAAEKLKNAVICMADSCDPARRLAALITTIWTWRLIPQICQNPSILPFAKIIDGTLELESCGCHKKINKGIDLLALSLQDGSNFVVATTMKNAGCCYKDVTPLLPQNCNQGTSHRGKELWKGLGSKYPSEFRDAALCLIRSDCYQDQLLGAIATASTTQALSLFYDYVGCTVAYQLVRSQLGGIIPSEYCNDYQNQLETISVQVPCIAEKAACHVKSSLGCADDY